MANITFNTRIQNKIDTYENYDAVKDRFIPLKGEVCIATVSTKVDGVQSTPQTLIKIGDGTSTWGSLKWLSATAADVIASLKGSNPTLPAASITGLNEYISGQIQDTNTLYRLVASGDMGIQLQSKEKGEEDTAFKNVGSPIVLTAPTYSLIPGDTNGTVKFGITGSEAEVKVHGLGSAAYTESSAYAPAGAGVPSTDGVPTDYLLSPAGWVAPPSGGGENWELIQDITFSEDTTNVEITQDMQSNPISLLHVKGFLLCQKDTDVANAPKISFYFGSLATPRRFSVTMASTVNQARTATFDIQAFSGFVVGYVANGASIVTTNMQIGPPGTDSLYEIPEITIRVTNDSRIAIGGRLVVYGVKG